MALTLKKNKLLQGNRRMFMDGKPPSKDTEAVGRVVEDLGIVRMLEVVRRHAEGGHDQFGELQALLEEWLESAAVTVTQGVYRHYEGGEYLVHFVMVDKRTRQKKVAYEALYDHPEGQHWTCSVEDFLALVEHDGQQVPRFVFDEQATQDRAIEAD